MGHAGRRDDVHLQQAEAGYRTEVGWGGMEMSWGVLMRFRIGNGLELALFLLSLVVSLCLSLSLSLFSAAGELQGSAVPGYCALVKVEVVSVRLAVSL